MKNDVHTLYETSDGERFDKKEDADRHELEYALRVVIGLQLAELEINSVHVINVFTKKLLEEFDIYFKGEIVKLKPTAFLPGKASLGSTGWSLSEKKL